jgi:hypothetical protein
MIVDHLKLVVVAYNLMVRVSTRSGEFPQSLFIENVKLGATPVDWGGFASIFKGKYCGEVMSVKRLQPGQATAQERDIINKVRVFLTISAFLIDQRTDI